jgi:plastocyanin
MKWIGTAAALFCCLELVSCGGSSSPASSPVSATPVTSGTPAPSGSSSVAIVMNAATLGAKAFNPDTITVAIGTSLMWTNTDTISHTSTGDAGGWNSGVLVPGATFSVNFPTSGTYTYHCSIHPDMVGTVMVQ